MIRSAPSRLAASAVADNRHRRAGVDSGLDGAVVAGGEDVRQGEQGWQECGVLTNRQLHQGALRLGHPHRLALAAVDAVPGPQSAVPAGGLQALGAVVARVVRPHERGHHEIAGVEAGHL